MFLLDELPPVGSMTELGGAEGRHAATVRRIRPGELVLLGDGRGGRATATVRTVTGERLSAQITGRQQLPAPRLRVVLAQALVKGDRGELAVELATEAGVDEVLPWRASRCVAQWDSGPRGARALQRWRSTAREAAKQARRAWVPRVGDPLDTAELAKRAAAAAGSLVLHEGADTALATTALPGDGELVLVVGPEGGITEAELAELTAAGAVSVRLGPDVLRASTAAVVALGALGVLTERWAHR